MSEDTSDGFADQPKPMVKCLGCGFNVEQRDAISPYCVDINGLVFNCLTCKKCEACPDMRESYKRGYNAAVEDVCYGIRDKANPSRWKKVTSRYG